MAESQAGAKHSKSITAEDIMSEIVVTTSQDTPIRDAAHLMLRDRVNGLPIVDKNKNIIGMLTLTDLFMLVNQAAGNAHYDFYKDVFDEKQLKTSEVMSKNVETIAPETTLDEIIHVTLTKKIHTFPVVKDGKLVGIIGRHDILNAIFSFDQD